MENLNIENIRELASQNKIKWTEHGSLRMFERKIHREDIIRAIYNGSIIENYPNDYPFPSCLVLGIPENRQPLHIVCGIGKEYLYVITAYYPDNVEWEEEMRRRK